MFTLSAGQFFAILAPCLVSLSLQFIILKRLDKMALTAQEEQVDLDALTATVNTVLPDSVKLVNDLYQDNIALRAQIAAMGQAPTGLDPVAVKADVDAMRAKLAELQLTLTNTPDPVVVPPAIPSAP